MVFDHLAQMIDRKVELLYPRLGDALDEPFQQRHPGDVHHRFGNILGERPQAHALASGHNHSKGVLRRHQDVFSRRNFGEVDQSHQPSGVIHERNGQDVAPLHEFQQVALRAALLRGERLGIHGFPDRCLQVPAREQAPPDIAIRQGSKQLGLHVDHDRDAPTARLDRSDRLEERRVRL